MSTLTMFSPVSYSNKMAHGHGYTNYEYTPSKNTYDNSSFCYGASFSTPNYHESSGPITPSSSSGGRTSTNSAASKYVNLGTIGEGSYGLVLKCRERQTGRVVAIKKIIESEEDKSVRRIVVREIHLLKQLRHENLVNLLEVFRRKRHLYLVFDFVERSLLDHLEMSPNGLERNQCRRTLYQVVRALEFCHLHNIIHRDVKPENILISKHGVVKLCDFGFARTLAKPGEVYTEYVSTRWYRAPELLVGDTRYGRAVDIWALGCLAAEMMTGQPLFPGDSDIDQLFSIVKCFGGLCRRHEDRLYSNPMFRFEISQIEVTEPLKCRLRGCTSMEFQFASMCLELDPQERPTCSHLMRLPLFTCDGFANWFPEELEEMLKKDANEHKLAPVVSKPKRLLPDIDKCLQIISSTPIKGGNNRHGPPPFDQSACEDPVAPDRSDFLVHRSLERAFGRVCITDDDQHDQGISDVGGESQDEADQSTTDLKLQSLDLSSSVIEGDRSIRNCTDLELSLSHLGIEENIDVDGVEEEEEEGEKEAMGSPRKMVNIREEEEEDEDAGCDDDYDEDDHRAEESVGKLVHMTMTKKAKQIKHGLSCDDGIIVIKGKSSSSSKNSHKDLDEYPVAHEAYVKANKNNMKKHNNDDNIVNYNNKKSQPSMLASSSSSSSSKSSSSSSSSQKIPSSTSSTSGVSSPSSSSSSSSSCMMKNYSIIKHSNNKNHSPTPTNNGAYQGYKQSIDKDRWYTVSNNSTSATFNSSHHNKSTTSSNSHHNNSTTSNNSHHNNSTNSSHRNKHVSISDQSQSWRNRAPTDTSPKNQNPKTNHQIHHYHHASTVWVKNNKPSNHKQDPPTQQQRQHHQQQQHHSHQHQQQQQTRAPCKPIQPPQQQQKSIHQQRHQQNGNDHYGNQFGIHQSHKERSENESPKPVPKSNHNQQNHHNPQQKYQNSYKQQQNFQTRQGRKKGNFDVGRQNGSFSKPAPKFAPTKVSGGQSRAGLRNA